MILDEDKRTLHFKIAYWGPALAGKTSSLQHLHDSTPPSFRGELSCPHATESDRILFFDLEWLENVPRSHRVRLHLYTNPGSVLHDTSRQQALSDADGIVAVWDTRQERLDANTKSLDELGSFLSSQERSLRDVPLVHQYNKRDLRPVKALKGEEVLESPALPELEAALNGEGRPSFGSVAYQGVGVRESLRALTRSLLGSHRNCWVKAPEDSEFPSTLASLLETWREERRSSARSMLSDAWESAPNDTSLDELLADCHDHGLTFSELGDVLVVENAEPVAGALAELEEGEAVVVAVGEKLVEGGVIRSRFPCVGQHGACGAPALLAPSLEKT
ncbi:MAG: hypothetical protein AAF533_03675, partial [Acidobacteriota bacterium]